MRDFARSCGWALVLGGTLLGLVNATVTPLLLANAVAAELRVVSDLFAIRQSGAGLAALLLLFGCVGIHLVQRDAAGRLGAAAFATTFVGCALVLAVEWANLFVLRAVAQADPKTLAALDHSRLLNAGFGSAITAFALGWLMLSISVWRSRVLPRWAAGAIVAGLLAAPMLQATPLRAAGSIVGNVLLGVGLAGLGRAVARFQRSAAAA